MLRNANSSHKLKNALIVLLFAAVGGLLIFQSNASTALPADINDDGVVNISDLSILLSNWGRTASPSPTPPGPTPTPPPSGNIQYPADLFEKNERWKITIPEVSGGKVVEIKPPAFGTYTSKYFYLNSAKTAAIFRVWHGGGTTSNSSNPRSELRERYNNDPEGYWSTSGTHTMEVVTQVNRLTKVKPHVVIAQVHGGGDDVSVWRVEGTKLYITDGDNTHGHLVDSNYTLGKKITVKYEIKDGTFNYYYNGTKVNYTLKYSGTGYFKAGNYLQSNPSSAPGESTSEYSEVEMYSAKITHSN